MNMQKPISRRALVKGGLIAGSLFPVVGIFVNASAFAESPALDPNDPSAKSLGYVIKSAKPGQECTNCVQFVGKASAATGGCNIFPGKTVAGGGWCMSYAKKPAA
jgi:High potential iron-sulfur protein